MSTVALCVLHARWCECFARLVYTASSWRSEDGRKWWKRPEEQVRRPGGRRTKKTRNVATKKVKRGYHQNVVFQKVFEYVSKTRRASIRPWRLLNSRGVPGG
ncbi:hypothetical protein IWX92DRAFT_160652 [Phyllosticta citricarpa]